MTDLQFDSLLTDFIFLGNCDFTRSSLHVFCYNGHQER